MPFRALAGYFVGQAATPTFQIGASVWALRHELGGGVVAEPYWTRETVKLFVVYSLFVALYSLVPSFTGFYETLLIRQRLSNVDSAAYYMISRFAEIGTYAGATLFSDIHTGIDNSASFHESTAEFPTYSLTGQRVCNSYKGIVIVNGKKYIKH